MNVKQFIEFLNHFPSDTEVVMKVTDDTYSDDVDANLLFAKKKGDLYETSKGSIEGQPVLLLKFYSPEMGIPAGKVPNCS